VAVTTFFVCIAATSGLGGEISRVFTEANTTVEGMAGGWEVGMPPAPPPGGYPGGNANSDGGQGESSGGVEGQAPRDDDHEDEDQGW
jgi:hypothetical protein